MRNFILLFMLCALLSCRDKKKDGPDPILAAEHFEKGSELMLKGLRTEFERPDSSKQYYQGALDQFLAAYRADSSLQEVAIYLPDVYYKLGKHDSASYWNKRLGRSTK